MNVYYKQFIHNRIIINNVISFVRTVDIIRCEIYVLGCVVCVCSVFMDSTLKAHAQT